VISAGIDIGSRTVKLVVLQDGRPVIVRKRENTFDPLTVCREMTADLQFDSITATGYGRHLFAGRFPCQVISEIKAFAIGAKAIYPACRSILDIGGQDIKAISLDSAGSVRKFEMNDKCSAGTGRFLEIMAVALGADMNEFSEMALNADGAEKINSMCTVFAESEVISLLARGATRGHVALGIHRSIIGRAKSLLLRTAVEDDLVFIGGVALNRCAVKLLGDAVQRMAHVPEDPQVVGAYGCALHSVRSSVTANNSSRCE
jgi:(R)-2-hydroxyacyl-CoA dehydratese activating ATPase